MPQLSEEYFKNKFFPADGKYKPQKGQVLARFRAKADLEGDWVKRNMIDLLTKNLNGSSLALKIATKVLSIKEKSAVALVKEMLSDLSSGMQDDEVMEKKYQVVIEQLYWTNPEYVPDDPHWDRIDLKFTNEETNNN